jgi:hypothetical protein
VFDDVAKPLGMARFAPMRPAAGPMFSARERARLPEGAGVPAPAVSEEELSS